MILLSVSVFLFLMIEEVSFCKYIKSVKYIKMYLKINTLKMIENAVKIKNLTNSAIEESCELNVVFEKHFGRKQLHKKII